MGGKETREHSQRPAETTIDTEKLNPKVKKWLMEADDRYTSYSVPKEPSGEQQSKASLPESKVGEAYRDPELVALENLKLCLPLFPGPKTRTYFTLAQEEAFEKKMFVPDIWPILVILQDYQSFLNSSGHQIANQQAIISHKIEDQKMFVVKVLHNLAILGSEIQIFEEHLQAVHNLDQSLKTMQDRLRGVVKKTFNLLDIIPEDERIDMPCPITVSIPYLRKDQYSSTNLYEKTTYYAAITPEDRERFRGTEDKWLQDILPNWSQFIDATKDKTSPYWRSEIPFRLRGYVWRKLIGDKLDMTIEKYMELQVMAHQYQHDPDKNDVIEQVKTVSTGIVTINSPKFIEKNIRELIRRDLPRTFPDQKLFKNSESDAYNQILKVLETAAYFQPNIGYVQGMSYLAATLLLFMNHYDSFVCFTNLLNTPFMRSVCQVDPASLAKHSQLFQIIFAQYAPELYQHFNNLNITTEHFLLDWWITLFTKSVSIPIACHIWDCFLIEGEIFIHFVAVGALKLFETQLLKASFEDCLDLITLHIPKNLSDASLFSVIRDFEITPKIQAIMEEMDRETENTT